MGCDVSEKTLYEELNDLDIDENIKKRLIDKLERLVNESTRQSECLYNCHKEIDLLNKAIISQAKTIARLEDDIRNIGIKPL